MQKKHLSFQYKDYYRQQGYIKEWKIDRARKKNHTKDNRTNGKKYQH